MKFKKLVHTILVVIALLAITLACSLTQVPLSEEKYEQALKDLYRIRDTGTGTYAVYKEMCLYAIEEQGMDSPAAYYVSYAWFSGTGPRECLATFSDLPLKSADVIQIGFTDLAPEKIKYIVAGLYENPSAQFKDTSAEMLLNSYPIGCPPNFGSSTLSSCTVTMIVPIP